MESDYYADRYFLWRFQVGSSESMPGKNKVDVYRTQWPVGQGGFSTGQVCFGSTRFDYVYDCGSTKRLWIDDRVYEYSAKTSRVDALFVSHLDSDHVKGLDALLSETKVHTVYLPYLDSVSALFVVLNAALQDDLSFDLAQLAADPGNWFGSRGVSRVVLVERGADIDGEPGAGVPEILSPEGDGQTDERAPQWSDDRPEIVGALVGPPGKRPKVIKESLGFAAQQLILPAGGACAVHQAGQVVWELIPYVPPLDPVTVKAFVQLVGSVFPGIKVGAQVDADALLDVLKDPEKRKRLKDCYLRLHPDGQHNNVSMVLYAGFPAGVCHHNRLVWQENRHWERWATACAWLGTGDAPLASVGKVNALERYLGHRIHNVGTLMLPHHGSTHNFCTELLDLIDPQLAFICARQHSKHHPSPGVLSDVLKRGIRFHHVSELATSTLHERLIATV